MVDTGEDRRGGQVGVGVGAADAVLDMSALGRPTRYAEGHGAVVHPPALGQRRVAVGLEAAEGVGVGAEDGQGVQQGGHHAADGVAQQGRAVGVFAGVEVVALGIGEADVHVQPAACAVAEGLGHEAGLQPVAVRHALDQALVADAFVHRLERVEAVLQGQLHLAGGVLGDRRAHRQALDFAGGVEVVEEGLQLLQLVDAIDLRRFRAHAVHLQCRLWTAVGVALLVQQVELQLHGHHRVEAVGLEAVDHPHQGVAWIGRRGRQALGRVHAHLQLAGGRRAPGLQGQAAGQGIGPAVGVGHVPDQAGAFHIFALDGQGEDGAGQGPAVLVDGQQLVAVQQLAARHAVGVDEEEFEAAHLGVAFEEVTGFLDIGESHGGFSHGADAAHPPASVPG
ncbi:hypothetical protein D9M68_637220 [compost metagenome]